MTTVDQPTGGAVCPMSGRIDLDALGAGFRHDPHPLLADVRESESVRRVVFHGMNAWIVTRYDDVRAAQVDARLSADLNNAPAEVRALPWVAAPQALGIAASLANLDPPDHTRLRRMVNGGFTARRIDALRPHARAVAERVIADLLPRGRADIMADYAVPIASQVIMALIGVTHRDSAEFHYQASALVSTDPADAARLPQALAWLQAYIVELLAAKRATPDDDLIGSLIHTDHDGDNLADGELRALTLLLLLAGFEATSSLIGSGMLALLTNPDQLAALRADPSLMPGAVEEMLRFDGPSLMSLMKFAMEDIEIDGVLIPRGDPVFLSLSTANRDPRRFTCPEAFDVTRAEGSHMGFGHGIHRCLGAPLARMATQTAFSVLLERCADIRLAVPAADLVYRTSPALRGLKHLPVLITPA
ncbi:MAG TPA: cytochrome P450 [Actinokineospora sp.]|jgi:cytochrome P450|nr:cytochrome P450 [Actinokineospora sp.]